MRPIPKWALLLRLKLLATLSTTVVLTRRHYGARLRGDLTWAGHSGGEHIAWRCLQAASIHAVAVVALLLLVWIDQPGHETGVGGWNPLRDLSLKGLLANHALQPPPGDRDLLHAA